MALARKCDVCGAYFVIDPDCNKESNDAIVFTKRHGLWLGREGSDRDVVLDCCEECVKSIQDHIEKRREVMTDLRE